MQSLTREKGEMKITEFNLLLAKLCPELIYLSLFFQGEPFLNPYFSEMVKMARKKRIFVSSSTNGHYLDDKNVAAIISNGLNHIIVSLDGLDQKTYEKYRVNGNLQTVTDGVIRLVAAKKAANSALPIIELQFLVMRHNEHQMKLMKKFARQLGVDRLTFKTIQVYNFEKAAEIIPALNNKSRYRQLSDGGYVLARKYHNRCHRIWSSVVITWEGIVVPCCYDKNAEYQTGNLLTDSLKDIWRNHVYTSLRKKVLSSRGEIDICRNCGE
jgi:radical SAM protein with 4Fe4S-binding SPASM domain